MPMQSINPANGRLIKEFEEDSEAVVTDKIRLSAGAFESWRKMPLSERIALLRQVSDGLEANKHSLARTMTLEMGKLLPKAVAEIEKTQWLIRYYAENAPEFLAQVSVATDYQKSYVSFEPMGAILCIMPWNFPYWQVFRFAVPALLAGNTVLLKHASNVQGCASEIEGLFDVLPEGVFQNLAIGSDRVERVIRDEVIQGISLTGSSAAGKAVAKTAGSTMKKCVFELGGSDPYIVLADADLSRAIPACVTGRLMNAGQSCIGAKRFILVEPIADKFLTAFKAEFEKVSYGDPMNPDSGLAPMSGVKLRDELHEQVARSVEMGAKCITGGYVPDQPGAYYPPTILTGVVKGMPAYDEELFGPVASVLVVADDREALRVANDTPFGLGAAIFSQDVERAEQLIRDEVYAGCCFVNDFVRSDPRLPFGGVKESGYGRELSGFGIREFCNIKTVVVA